MSPRTPPAYPLAPLRQGFAGTLAAAGLLELGVAVVRHGWSWTALVVGAVMAAVFIPVGVLVTRARVRDALVRAGPLEGASVSASVARRRGMAVAGLAIVGSVGLLVLLGLPMAFEADGSPMLGAMWLMVASGELGVARWLVGEERRYGFVAHAPVGGLLHAIGNDRHLYLAPSGQPAQTVWRPSA